MTKHGRSGRRWLWLRDGLIPVGQAVNETIPLYALIVLIAATGQHGLTLSYVMLAGMVATAAWLTRLTDLLPRFWYCGRVVLSVLTVLFLVLWAHLTLAPEAAWNPPVILMLISRPWLIDPTISGGMLFTSWFLGVCLWSRGLWIGLQPAAASTESRWFIGGMAILLLLVIVASTGTGPQAAAVVQPLRILVLTYFFVGLLVLALVHAATLSGTGGPTPGASVPWLVAVAVPIAAVPLAGLFLTVGVAPAVRVAMWTAVDVGLVAWHVALWIGYWILLFLAWLSSLFPAWPGGPLHSRAGAPRPPPPVRLPGIAQHFASSTFDATIIVVLLAAAMLVGMLAWLLTRQRVAIEVAVSEEERSSVWSWALFLSQMRALWDALWQRRSLGLKPNTGAAAVPAAPTTEDEFDVRALYRRFLQRAALLRYPHPPTVTPWEFARILLRSAPAHAQEIGQVTDIYDRTRYGHKTLAHERKMAMRDAVLRWEGHEGHAIGDEDVPH